MSSFQETKRDEAAQPEEPVALRMPGPSADAIKGIVQKRLDFAAKQSEGILVATIEDSGLAVLMERYQGNMHAILGMAGNSVQYAVEVDGKTSPISIDEKLVNDTIADITKTLEAEEGDELGKLRTFAK